MQIRRDWNAHWIWPKGEGTRKNTYYYFRKTFEVSKPGMACTLYITADTRYKVYVNERMIGYGPPLSVAHNYYYDVYAVDLTMPRQGTNCIAVEVYQLGLTEEAAGGFLCELTDEEGHTVVRSDESWKSLRAVAWRSETHYFRMSMYSPFQEHYDARKVPEGWMRPGFVDRDWFDAQIVKGKSGDKPPAVMPWSGLYERDIPHMKETPKFAERVERVEESIDLLNRQRSEDLSILLSIPGQLLHYARLEQAEALLQPTGDTLVQSSTNHLTDREFDGTYYPCVILDFGKSINAFLELELSGKAGGVVDIGYAERLTNGHFVNSIEGMFADQYVMKGGHQRFRPFTWKSFRYVKLAFRSLSAIQVHSVKALVSEYPYEPRGSFHSSDETMNKVFDICRYTIGLCSNDSIMDTPWREQAQFVGDVAAVTLSGIYSCFGDTMLTGKFLKQSAANQLPSGLLRNVTNSDRNHFLAADYSLWWIYGVWNHYRYTGEEEWIHRYYPTALKIIDAYLEYLGKQDMIEEMPYLLFIDWAGLDRRGISAAHNAIFYGVAGLVEQMAALKGDAYMEEKLKKIRSAMKESFSRLFYCQERGCYADTWMDGQLSSIISEQTNMAAIYWDLCDAADPNRIVERILGPESIEHTESQPFFTMITLRVLEKLGRTDLAVELIRHRWGRRMVDKGATSTYEEWGLNGSWRKGKEFTPAIRTQSHAWSAYPAEYLIRDLAGFEIVEPGCRKVKLNPKETGFDYALAIPVPQGEISVCRSNGRIEIAVPDGVTVV